MTAIERLKQETDGISESQAQKVLDFLLFVWDRHAPRIADWPQGLFERPAGPWKGEPLERAPQGE